MLLRRWQSFRQIFYSISRTMSATPADEIGEELRRNPFYDKYADKLLSFKKENPEEFLTRLEESKTKKSKDTARQDTRENFSTVLNAKEKLRGGSSSGTNPKALENIMKLELIEDKTNEEIKEIWESYHKQKEGISATIPHDLYDLMYKNGKAYPVFVFPLPRGQGYEFFLCQVDHHTVHFTPLINYQAHKENAPVCLTMIHYVELKEKGIVLMNGEFNKDVIDAKGAQFLANQFQLYYGRENQKRLKLMETLNYSPSEFRHMDVIAELECMSL